MVRIGLGILAAGGLLALSGLIACSSGSNGPNIQTASGGSSGSSGAGGASGSGGSPGGSGGGGTTPSGCTAACCPTDAMCYSDPTLGKNSPGAECLSTVDNTPALGTTGGHIQMRQMWIHPTSPPGNADVPIVYQALSQLSDLPYPQMTGQPPTCGQGAGLNGGLGAGGYIQVIDFFLSGAAAAMGDYIPADYSTVGYSTYVSADGTAGAQTTLTQALTDGLCMGTVQYTEAPAPVSGVDVTKFALKPSQMGPTDQWTAEALKVVPHPMPLVAEDGTTAMHWNVIPTKAKRLVADFGDTTQPTERETMLKRFDKDDPSYVGDGYTGVFFFDPATGYAHGFGLIAYLVIYNDAKNYIVVPIREVDTKSTFNDPAHPDCTGEYDPSFGGTDALPPATCVPSSAMDPTAAAWGGGAKSDCTKTTGSKACAAGQGPTKIVGYFMSTELQQVFSSTLGSTLCASYQDPKTRTSDGFFVKDSQGVNSCITAGWDPTKADQSGLPKGDWCAGTNSAATATCHDAWQSTSFHVFAGGKIKLGTDGTPATCPAQP